MHVIRLRDGRLRVPHSAIDENGTIAQAYVEIGPDDPDYERLSAAALTEEELADRRREWREDDEALRLQFEEWKTQQPD